jgi:hypothetical protein
MCGWKLHERTTPVRQRTFFWLSVGRSLAQVGAVYLVLLGLFVAELGTGELIGLHFWGAVALLTGLMGVLAFAMWRVALQPPFAFFARHGIDMDVLLADARMRKTADGTWLYMDDHWYVAVRPGVACALFSPLIDFTQTFHVERRTSGLSWRSMSYSYDLVTYVAKDGTRIFARYAEAGGALRKWLKRFGGRLC